MNTQEYSLDDFYRARPPVSPIGVGKFPVLEENCPLDEYYYVSIDEEDLLITQREQPELETDCTNICELDVDGGKLIGINNGEWGGGLFLVTKKIEDRLYKIDGQRKDHDRLSFLTKKAYCIENKETPHFFNNIRDIFRHGDRIFYLTGLCHLSDNGALLEVVAQGGKYVSKFICYIDSCPQMYDICDDRLCVLALNRLVVIDLSNDSICANIESNSLYVCTSKTEEPTKWQSLTPTSIALLNYQCVYIGYNGGIQRFDLYNGTMYFYVRKEYKMNKVTILYPSDYFDRKKVDGNFVKEYEEVCKIPEFNPVLYNHDVYINEGAPALREHPVLETGLCIARTWMLSGDQYRIIRAWLGAYGADPINTVSEYDTMHYFPQIYPMIKDYTPKILFYSDPNVIDAEEVSDAFSRFMIKDEVKSVKGYDFPTYFETPITQEELMENVRKFIELRDNLFSGGIVFKEYVNLKRYGDATNEYRVFYFMGEVLSISRNSNQPEGCPFVSDSLVRKFCDFPSNYYTVDFGELESGEFTILEAGDGQVSGLSPNQYVFKYYDDMRYILEEKGLIHNLIKNTRKDQQGVRPSGQIIEKLKR